MELTLAQVVEATGAACVGNADALARTVRGWSIDSRTASEGDLFFAIKGEHHDGHVFVNQVLARGAVAAVVSQAMPEAPGRCIARWGYGGGFAGHLRPSLAIAGAGVLWGLPVAPARPARKTLSRPVYPCAIRRVRRPAISTITLACRYLCCVLLTMRRSRCWNSG